MLIVLLLQCFVAWPFIALFLSFVFFRFLSPSVCPSSSSFFAFDISDAHHSHSSKAYAAHEKKGASNRERVSLFGLPVSFCVFLCAHLFVMLMSDSTESEPSLFCFFSLTFLPLKSTPRVGFVSALFVNGTLTSHFLPSARSSIGCSWYFCFTICELPP